MKTAISRKNVWEKTPASIKRGIGKILGAVPPRYLLGGRFRKNLAVVLEAQDWPEDRIRTYQLRELQRILALAYENTGFYRREFDRVGFEPGDLKSVEDLARLPTINKDTLREHLSEMCAVPPTSSGIDLVSTGGSSGEPLRFYINANRSAAEYAHLVAGWMRVGYRLDLPQVVLRGQMVEKNRDGLRHFYDGVLRRHYYSNFHMSDKNLLNYLEHIATVGPCYLHAYPSSATHLARFMNTRGERCPKNILGVLVGSETVHADDRKLVERVFGVRYYSWYGHSEKLVMGVECEHSTDYHVWPTYGFFELLDQQGRNVSKPGETGEIVGTGFINTVVPFIRYRTGDIATYVGQGCDACGRAHPIMRSVVGRWPQGALVAKDGSVISMTAFNVHDDTFEQTRGYQFYQAHPGVAVLRVASTGPLSDADRARILIGATRRLQGQVDLTLELWENLEKTRQGKQLRVVSDLKAGMEISVEASSSKLQDR